VSFTTLPLYLLGYLGMLIATGAVLLGGSVYRANFIRRPVTLALHWYCAFKCVATIFGRGVAYVAGHFVAVYFAHT